MTYLVVLSLRMENESRKSEVQSRKSIRIKNSDSFHPNPNLIRMIRIGFGFGWDMMITIA